MTTVTAPSAETTATSIEEELERVRGILAETTAAGDEAEQRLRVVRLHMRDDLPALEAQAALGEIDEADVSRRRGELTTEAAEKEAEIERMRSRLPGLEQRIAQLERALLEQQLDAAANALHAASQQGREHAATLGKQLRGPTKTAEAYLAARAEIREREREVQRLAELLGVDCPLAADEEEWRPDGLDLLKEAIRLSLHTPHADRDARAGGARRRTEEWESTRINSAARTAMAGSPDVIDRLPEHLRPAARARWKELVELERAFNPAARRVELNEGEYDGEVRARMTEAFTEPGLETLDERAGRERKKITAVNAGFAGRMAELSEARGEDASRWREIAGEVEPPDEPEAA